MDIALIKHAEHDIYCDERRENEPWLVAQRLLKCPCGSLERAVDSRRHAEPGHDLVDGGHCVAERVARRQVERNGGSDGQALVIDGERDVAGGVMSDGAE